eukprot:IDg4706t1
MLRKLLWHVSVEDMNEPLLGRPILEALGLNTKELLAAACDRLEGDVDATDILLANDYADGSCAKTIASGLYHATGKYENHNDLEDNDEMFVDIGEDTPDEISDALNTLVKTARPNGLSSSGEKMLNGILENYQNVFRIRLGKDPPAKVQPMRVELKPNTTPFVSPLLVPKDSPAKFRLTFDLRGVNARTVSNAWPMPHLDSELMDFSGSKCFASIDFTSAYWQLPLDEETAEYHSVMGPKGIMTPTRTLQGA